MKPSLVKGMTMEHDVVVTRADGSVRKFRIFGQAAPRIGDVVMLPMDGKLIKTRIDKISGAEKFGSAEHVETQEMETA